MIQEKLQSKLSFVKDTCHRDVCPRRQPCNDPSHKSRIGKGTKERKRMQKKMHEEERTEKIHRGKEKSQKRNLNYSCNSFRSSDLRVMSPARFRCAMQLVWLLLTGVENPILINPTWGTVSRFLTVPNTGQGRLFPFHGRNTPTVE